MLTIQSFEDLPLDIRFFQLIALFIEVDLVRKVHILMKNLSFVRLLSLE